MTKLTKGIPLTEEQRFYWLRLIRSENVGAATFWTLLKKYQTAQNVLKHLPELSQNAGKRALKIANEKDVEEEMKKANRLGVRFICVGEPDYPAFLYEMDCTPPVISIRGNAELFKRTGISIVGSRNASASALLIARLFAQDLSKAGFSIISGFARGVDTEAHKGSLEQGTIGVLAGGVNLIYPPENKQIYHKILDKGGVFVSEMPLSFPPRANDFPRRNRLIAGLSLGLLVIEAAYRSGSLITARLANDMGRQVFSIPGCPLEARSIGTNNLIKNGANLVTKASDIIEILTPMIEPVTEDLAPLIKQKIIKKKPIEDKDQLHFFKEDSAKNDFYSTVLDSEKMAQQLFQTKTMHCEVEAELNATFDHKENKEEHNLSDIEREKILNALSMTPISLENLSYCTNISLKQLHLGLAELDLAGKIIRYLNGLVSLKP